MVAKKKDKVQRQDLRGIRKCSLPRSMEHNKHDSTIVQDRISLSEVQMVNSVVITILLRLRFGIGRTRWPAAPKQQQAKSEGKSQFHLHYNFTRELVGEKSARLDFSARRKLSAVTSGEAVVHVRRLFSRRSFANCQEL